MTTGKQSAVHAQQNSDGTFELHVDSGEEHFSVDEPTPEPKALPAVRNWRILAAVGIGVVVIVAGAGLLVWSQHSERGEIAGNLEPVQGFRPYTGGAGAPAVTQRPVRPSAPVVDDFEEEFEDEAGGVIEPEPPREEAVVPMRPPAVLENRVIEEVEESPEESGWELEEGVEEVDSDEQGYLLENLKRRGRLEQIDRNAHLNNAQLPVEAIARSKRHLAIESDLRRAGDRARFARVARTPDEKDSFEGE